MFMVKGVTIFLVYRPPSGGAETISELANLVRTAGKDSMLIGDFNLPDIDWQAGNSKGEIKGIPGSCGGLHDGADGGV